MKNRCLHALRKIAADTYYTGRDGFDNFYAASRSIPFLANQSDEALYQYYKSYVEPAAAIGVDKSMTGDIGGHNRFWQTYGKQQSGNTQIPAFNTVMQQLNANKDVLRSNRSQISGWLRGMENNPFTRALYDGSNRSNTRVSTDPLLQDSALWSNWYNQLSRQQQFKVGRGVIDNNTTWADSEFNAYKKRLIDASANPIKTAGNTRYVPAPAGYVEDNNANGTKSGLWHQAYDRYATHLEKNDPAGYARFAKDLATNNPNAYQDFEEQRFKTPGIGNKQLVDWRQQQYNNDAAKFGLVTPAPKQPAQGSTNATQPQNQGKVNVTLQDYHAVREQFPQTRTKPTNNAYRIDNDWYDRKTGAKIGITDRYGNFQQTVSPTTTGTQGIPKVKGSYWAGNTHYDANDKILGQKDNNGNYTANKPGANIKPDDPFNMNNLNKTQIADLQKKRQPIA